MQLAPGWQVLIRKSVSLGTLLPGDPRRSILYRFSGDGSRSAARAQNRYMRAGKAKAVFGQHPGKAIPVGIMAGQDPLFVFNGIDRAKEGCLFG